MIQTTNSTLNFRPREHSVLKLGSVLVLLYGLLAPTTVFAQRSIHTATIAEYDRWQGSSLGVGLEEKEGGIRVTQVYTEVAGESGLREGDQVLSIGGIDFSEKDLDQLRDLMAATGPRESLPARIVRDGQQTELKIRTYRRPLVDAASIVRAFRSSQVVLDHLNASDRSSFLDDMGNRLAAAVRNSSQPREAYEGLNGVIDEIGVSHSAFIPKSAGVGFSSGERPDIGLTLQRDRVGGHRGYFVIDRMPGTVGYESDIQLGDEILFINGVAIENSARLVLAGEEQRHQLFSIRVAMDETVRLEYRVCKCGPMITTRVKPTQTITALDALEKSVRVIEHRGRQFGYLRLWNLMSMKTSVLLRQYAESAFVSCDGLILDLRGRGGLLPAVMAVERVVQDIDVPVVAITDRLSRSAKELLSHRLKKIDHVTVIGERTAGAVTGATMTTLPSGHSLMYPVASGEVLKRFSDGVNLEGKGVDPDVQVNFFIPYCQGRDKLLESALDYLRQSKKESPANTGE